ncbi:hypothetical protein [Ligilactobacillus sp. LYQ60]|uniref:hypothetical protein n=1 Tax=unclassified Ligilactobacillus TaxID=2767920 RepID=UPI00385367A3
MGIFIVWINVLTGLIEYYSSKSIFHNKLVALTFSILYVFATYRSLDLYRRFDIGEFIAMAFIPLVVSALYQIIVCDKQRWMMLAVAMALILYSHLLSLVLCGVAGALEVIALYSLSQNKWRGGKTTHQSGYFMVPFGAWLSYSVYSAKTAGSGDAV